MNFFSPFNDSSDDSYDSLYNQNDMENARLLDIKLYNMTNEYYSALLYLLNRIGYDDDLSPILINLIKDLDRMNCKKVNLNSIYYTVNMGDLLQLIINISQNILNLFNSFIQINYLDYNIFIIDNQSDILIDIWNDNYERLNKII